jgi:transposase-like protein
MLPAEGVAAHFKTETARLNRLIEVRWPHGPYCNRCQSPSPTWIATRSLFQCRQCRYQYSATVDTFLHRTRLPLETWFCAIESSIRAQAIFGPDFQVSAHVLARTLGIQYLAARRVRKLILAEIEPGQTGILLKAVCVRPVDVPHRISKNSMDHLRWLLEGYYWESR